MAPPKAGKTTLLKKLANAISTNYPDINLIVLLIDERPEEVTDMQRSIKGDVIYSTFDQLPEKPLPHSGAGAGAGKEAGGAEQGRCDIADSITRLARAYNLTVPPTGRTLSGVLTPARCTGPSGFSARRAIRKTAAA